MREIIVDSFAGGGGASTGIEMAQVRICGNSVSPPVAGVLFENAGVAL